jgi:hypothetical protein
MTEEHTNDCVPFIQNTNVREWYTNNYNSNIHTIAKWLKIKY